MDVPDSSPKQGRARRGGSPSEPASAAVKGPRAIRLSSEEREHRVIQGAISFFAEVGLSGDIRQLARRLNITHSLLFRYFGSKDALLERVYQEVYMRHWNPFWETMIQDRGVPLQARMRAFYNDYARAILSYEWVRIFLYSGLRDGDFHRRFLQVLRSKVFIPLCAELRHELGLPGFDLVPVTEAEIDLVWGSHSKIFYYGVRKWVYQASPAGDISELIDLDLNAFFGGAPNVVRQIVAAKNTVPKAVNGTSILSGPLAESTLPKLSAGAKTSPPRPMPARSGAAREAGKMKSKGEG